MNMFTRKFQRLYKNTNIPVLRVQGHINRQTTLQIQNGLNSINPEIAVAMAVVVNSPGGSPVQSELIVQKLQNFSDYYNIPIYTFAEESALSSAYYILSIGHKIYADQISQIGCIGTDPDYIGLKYNDLENFYELQKQKNLWFKHNPDLKNMTKEVEKIFTQLHSMAQDELMNDILNLRNLNTYNLRQHGPVFQGEKAKQYGLVDDLGNYQDIMGQMYPEDDIVLADQNSKKQQFHMYIRQSLEIIKQVKMRQKKTTKLENNIQN